MKPHDAMAALLFATLAVGGAWGLAAWLAHPHAAVLPAAVPFPFTTASVVQPYCPQPSSEGDVTVYAFYHGERICWRMSSSK